MRTIVKGLSGFMFAVLVSSGAWAADAYVLDPVHSSIGFSVRHMMVAKVNGVFKDYQGNIAFSATDLANSTFDFVIKAASIDTRNEARDAHLRSPDFFDAAAFSDIVFRTKKVVAAGTGVYNVTGDLTMKGVTKEIVIPVTVLGPVFNPMAKVDGLGVETNFTLNRQDYGVKWNKSLDNGGVVVGDNVEVAVSLEVHKK